MPGGMNELQGRSGSHIITYHRWNRFCLFAGEKKEGNRKAALFQLDQQGRRHGMLHISSMDSIDTAILQRLSFTSDLSFLSIHFQGIWKGLFMFHKDESVCIPTGYHAAWRTQGIVTKPSLIQSCLMLWLFLILPHLLFALYLGTAVTLESPTPRALRLEEWKSYLPPLSL